MQVPDVEHGRRTALSAVEALRAAFGGAIHDHVSFRGEETVHVDPARLVEIGRWLRESPELAYVFLTDITAIHWLERDTQYEVAYLLYSFRHNSRLRLKVRPADGGDRVPTVTGVWRAADWLEREEWDKVGVVFEGHPNLKRILLPEDWEGHPLRKDYPMEGIGA
jgi:NADH-quinone oxidoreductase subunit C